MANDTVPTLTTTNHLHIPTLFMHQSRVQNPNLDLSMPWQLGPDHHVDVQHKQIQPNKQHGPSDSLVRDRSSGTQKEKMQATCNAATTIYELTSAFHRAGDRSYTHAQRDDFQPIVITRQLNENGPGSRSPRLDNGEQPTALMEQSRQTQRKMQRN